MSVIIYNGITLPYAYTTGFRQEARYDDMGETDWYCTRFDIQVQAVLNANYLDLVAPDLLGTTDNASQIMRVIRSRLLKPRKTLSVKCNEIELIPQVIGGNSGTVDAQNGPKPQSCVITQMSNVTFLIHYHIIAHYWENNLVTPAANPSVRNRPGNNVLYNRWSESVEMDSRNFVTRRRDGKCRIRSDNPSGFIAAQVIPQMAVVGVPKGFLRQNSEYTVTPDGLAIQYRVVDKEQYKMPPGDAYEAQGSYYESSTRGDGKRYCEVQLLLRTSKAVSQFALVQTAMAVATTKLAINGAPLIAPAPVKAIVETAGIKINMYDNEVELNIRVLAPVNPKRLYGVAAFQNTPLTWTPGSDEFKDDQIPPDYPVRGTASRLIQAAAYYDPSLRNTVLDSTTGQLSAGLEVGRAGRESEAPAP